MESCHCHSECCHEHAEKSCCCCHHCEHCHAETHEADEKWEKLRILSGGILFAAAAILFYACPEYAHLSIPAFIAAWLILGIDVAVKAVRTIFKGHFLDENFLMTLASIGAFAIAEYPEAVAVMFFYRIGEMLEDKAVEKSRHSISSLLEMQPDTARVRRDDQWLEISPENIEVGELILVRPGERIPLDGRVTEGESRLDMQAITGESVPKKVRVGDELLSGCINLESALTLEVTHVLSESMASKIIELVETAQELKTPAERFITKFARFYTPIVVGCAALLALIPPLLLDGLWSVWLQRAFVFLVVSCPCALVISVPMAYFCGIGAASRRGILFRGSACIEALCKIRTMVFDKTGTLTQGTFEITHVEPAPGIDADSLLKLAASAEAHSNHPIARSILNSVHDYIQPDETVEKSGLGIQCRCGHDVILVGNAAMMASENVAFQECGAVGTLVYVARNGEYLGCIVISDAIRPESLDTMQRLRDSGIKKLVMLTGDSEKIAESVSSQLKLDEFHANLKPADKLAHFNELAESMPAAFVGDGMNDAPVLASAGVGIAMGGAGSDAAIDAADVVLMGNQVGNLPFALSIARKTHGIAVQNIIFALSVKFILLILGALGIIGLWVAVFGDVGVMVIAVCNALRMNSAGDGVASRS